SRTDHAPAWLPGTDPAAAAPHVANDRTNNTPPVRVKNPRLTSVHSGVRNSSTSPPETVSARTSAVTPAGPDTPRAYPGDGGLPSPEKVGNDAAFVTRSPVVWMAVDDWRSYDSVAETYARIHAPRLAEPAHDLVELTGIEAGWNVLDVGTGTGVAAFDALLANFVLAHFTKYKTALFDMKRVLRPGGRLGLTAWADAEDDLARTWLELVGTVVPPEVLQAAMDERLPWRERFRRRLPLEEALMEAGIRHVRTEVRRYRFQYSLDDYVEGLSTWATGRFVRFMLGESAFAEFVGRARVEFGERFADPVNDFREVLFATGAKP